MSNNSGPGISVTADSAINLTQIDTNTLDGNSTSVVLNTLNNGTIATRVTNNTMNNSLNDGFVANADTGVITLNEFSGNTLNDAGGNGILLSAAPMAARSTFRRPKTSTATARWMPAKTSTATVSSTRACETICSITRSATVCL